MMAGFKVIEVHKSMVFSGDCIIHDNKEMTVSNSDIRMDSFMGLLIFGDSYNLGRKLVKKLVYVDPIINN